MATSLGISIFTCGRGQNRAHCIRLGWELSSSVSQGLSPSQGYDLKVSKIQSPAKDLTNFTPPLKEMTLYLPSHHHTYIILDHERNGHSRQLLSPVHGGLCQEEGHVVCGHRHSCGHEEQGEWPQPQ